MASSLQGQGLFNGEGLIAVVTGGGSGIGSVIARALATNGASAVYILGIQPEPLQALAAIHSNIYPITCDVTSKEQLQLAVDLITQKTGYINLLVCNAGMASPETQGDPKETPTIQQVRNYFFSKPIEDHTATLNLNVTGVFLTSFAFLELLDAGNKVNSNSSPAKPTSQIVTIGSAGSFFRGSGSFMYNASKAATTHMMKHMATFLVPWDIRCNVIAPGWFHSKITEDFAKAFEATGGVMPKTLVPQQRFGSEEEMAGTILYLASKAGGYCNGSVLLVDGGTMSIHPSSY